LLGVLFSYGFLALQYGAAWYFGGRAFGEERIPKWTGMTRDYYRDALFIGLGGTAACAGLAAVLRFANEHLPGAQAGAAANFGSNLDAFLPAAAVVGAAVRSGLTLTAVIAIAAGFIAAVMRPVWLRVGVIALGAVAFGGFIANWHDPMDVAKKMVIAAVWVGAVDLGVRYVVRFNVLGYFLIVAGLALLGAAGGLLRHPDYFYQANGYGLVLALIVLFAWPLVAWRRGEAAKA